MREQLAALAKLARIDAAARDYDAELEELPRRIDEMRADVQRLEELLAREREQFDEAEGLKKSQQEDIAQRNEALARAKAKGAKARTPKEAEASEREIESNRRVIKEREEEIGRLDEAVGKVREQVEQHERELGELRALFEQEEQKANARMEELRGQRDKALSGREEVVGKLPKNILKRYERIRQFRGSGVALVADATCSGCSMALPPQRFIELQRGESVEQCPNCQRIMIYHGLVED